MAFRARRKGGFKSRRRGKRLRKYGIGRGGHIL